MKSLFPILCLTITSVCFSQDFNYDEVYQPLNDYMHGSSYNDTEQILKAFTDDATLYLTVRGGEFKRLSPEEYTNFFKNSTKGEFNGRDAKLLSLEVQQDIAIAKIEIAIPKAKIRFIDLLLLKETDSGWKIISKTATRYQIKQ